MRSSARKRFPGTDWPTLLTLSLLPIQWISLFTIGSKRIKTAHLALLLLGALFVLSRRQRKNALILAVRSWPFWCSVSAYLLWTAMATASVRGTINIEDFLRQGVYFAIWLMLASRVMLLGDRLYPTLYYTGLAALLTFFLALAISALKAGISLSDSAHSLLLGDLNSFALHFILPLMNSFGDGDLELSLSIKNAIAGMLLANLMVFLAGNSKLATGRQRGIGLLVTTCYLIIIPLTLSRSAIAVLALMFLLFGCRFLLTKGPLFAVASACLLLLAIAASLPVGGNTLLDVFTSIFIEHQSSYASRLQQYAVASTLITDHPWVGQGAGLRVGPSLIHNLFLAAWAQAGIVALFLASSLYVSTLLAWLQWLPRGLKVPGRAGSFSLWISALPVLPLFRVWISGDGGNLDPPGWIALALFFGIASHAGSHCPKAPVLSSPFSRGFPARPLYFTHSHRPRKANLIRRSDHEG